MTLQYKILDPAKDTLQVGDQFELKCEWGQWYTIHHVASGETFLPQFNYRRPSIESEIQFDESDFPETVTMCGSCGYRAPSSQYKHDYCWLGISMAISILALFVVFVALLLWIALAHGR